MVYGLPVKPCRARHPIAEISTLIRVVSAVASIYVCIIFGSTIAAAQGNGSEELFREALVCYGEINFHCSLDKLGKSRDAELSGENDKGRLTEIYRYMAYSQVALGREAEALESFRNIIVINPDFMLPPEKVSPKIYRLYLQAKREEERRGLPPKPPEEKPPDEVKPAVIDKEPQPPASGSGKPGVKLPAGFAGICGSAAFLTRSADTDRYHVGMSVDSVFGFRLPMGFFMGGEIFYLRHEAKAGEKNLNAVGVMARASWTYEVSRFWLQAPLGLGIMTYGRGNASDEQGLAWRIDPGFYARFTRHVAVGINVGPGGVFAFERSAASVFFTTGMSILGTW